MTIRKADQLDRQDFAEFDRHDTLPSRPECCRSGCTVCILDYPDAFPAQDTVVALITDTETKLSSPTPSSDEVDLQLLVMLEAFEQAEAIVATLVGRGLESELPKEGAN